MMAHCALVFFSGERGAPHIAVEGEARTAYAALAWNNTNDDSRPLPAAAMVRVVLSFAEAMNFCFVRVACLLFSFSFSRAPKEYFQYFHSLQPASPLPPRRCATVKGYACMTDDD